MNFDTPQSAALLAAKVCKPVAAIIIGLPFVERDIELIDYLNALTDLPGDDDFPSAQVIADVLQIELRWAAFTREKVLRFLHKRRINGNFSADIANFTARFDVAAFIPACHELPQGTTVFIGDSLMATNHFAANASFPILVGSLLESLGRGAFINLSVGGQTTKLGHQRFQNEVLPHNPVRVVICYGTNDLTGGRPNDITIANFDNMITQVKQHNPQTTIILGMLLPIVTHRLWWAKTPMKGVQLEERRPLHNAMLELAHRRRISCFDLFDRMTDAHYSIDGIHINQAGQEEVGVETLRLLTTS
ncbi:MAG: SGNH/GDSL hydrolase family protein [Phycisphaerales bacterium]|nr:SGNH/GDSL hydrolase family protein [Phycisphaerales bacterium]